LIEEGEEEQVILVEEDEELETPKIANNAKKTVKN